MEVEIFIFDATTMLDAVGAYEVSSRLPEIDVHTVSTSRGRKRSELGSMALYLLEDLRSTPRGEED